MTLRRLWESNEWQTFAIKLIQLRHKSQNVQLVPDTVKGDAGLECFSTDGCLYQCYAPEEASDVSKAASAMKRKGARDLGKLIKNRTTIKSLLVNLKVNRWFLVCPFLDDKEVIAYIRKKGDDLKTEGLSFLAPDFQALVQCPHDFAGEIEQLKMLSLGPPLQITSPSEQAITAKTGEISSRLSAKLARAFPGADATYIETQKASLIRAHLMRENALDLMRADHPILWDRSIRCLEAEELRLVGIGMSSGGATQQLSNSVARIEHSLKADLPNLTQSTITHIAVGTISDWLVRCPLDFPTEPTK